MKALVFGATGQDGSYLCELLLQKGYEVHGVIRRSSSFNTGRIDHIFDQLHLHYGDVTDPVSVYNIFEKVRPDETYNLSAQSHVRVSFDVPFYTAESTGLSVLTLLEANQRFGNKFYQASSSELFGKVYETPQSELTPFYPRSPYGIAKQFAYWSVVNYREAYGTFACNGLCFNHESPRRGETFVTRKICKAAVRIQRGLQDKLMLGNLDAKRDWGYAKDFVEAMYLMLQMPQADDYVIATGEMHSIRDFLDEAFGYLNMDWAKHVQIDPRLFRPTEVDSLLGDSSKAQKILGWYPFTKFKDLVRLMINAELEAQ